MRDLVQGTYRGCEWKVDKDWGFSHAHVQVPKSLQKNRREVENLPFLKQRFYFVSKEYSQKNPKKFDLWIKTWVHTHSYKEDPFEIGQAQCEKFIDELISLKEKIKKEEMEQLAKKLTLKG